MRKYLMRQRVTHRSFPSQDVSARAVESHSLAPIGSARHLDELIMDVALRALVHALKAGISTSIRTPNHVFPIATGRHASRFCGRGSARCLA
jgi:hypothetical protein